MTNSNETCTCPSGNGSLRHPCPIHSNENKLKVGDVVSESIAELERVAAGYAIRAIRVIKQQSEQLEAAKKEIAEVKSNRKGWQLVPVEPTQDMMAHMEGESWHESRESYYKLLEAAPKPEGKS